MCEVEGEHPKFVRWTRGHVPDLLEDELENTEPNIVTEKKKKKFSQEFVDVLLKTTEHFFGKASEVFACF